jgi:hypothetical protein
VGSELFTDDLNGSGLDTEGVRPALPADVELVLGERRNGPQPAGDRLRRMSSETAAFVENSSHAPAIAFHADRHSASAIALENGVLVWLVTRNGWRARPTRRA